MNLPPQAYTKETLIQAYNWLRSQPPHVQEMAKSPDILVSLYSKAQIHGENYLSRTNLQSFKSELKNLANIMGDLDESSNSPAPTPNSHSYNGASAAHNNNSLKPSATSTAVNATSSFKQQSSPNNTSLGTISNNSPLAGGTAAPTSQNMPFQASMTPMVSETNFPLFHHALANLPAEPELKNLLDARSWGMIQEIKNQLNLSSEVEVLRLLIALGYQKVRSQF